MCVSCGCDAPENNHGDTSNITLTDLDRAAAAAGISRDDVVTNIAALG